MDTARGDDPLGEREIRLLELHPGGREEQIRCSIHVEPLDHCRSYEALSYTWGKKPCEGDPKYEITVGKNKITVWESLYAALKWLRYPPQTDTTVSKDHGAFIDVNNKGDGVEIKNRSDLLRETRGKSRYLWADAICIKQDDDKEKGHQIQLMGDIYRKSSKGIIWLGEPTDLTERAFMIAYWLCKVSYYQESLGNGPKNLKSDRGDSKSGQRKPSFMTMTRLDNVRVKWTMCQCWKGLMDLTRGKWFTRAWVVQEATLSKDARFVCGDYSIPWRELLRALDFVPDIPIRPLAGVPVPSHMVVIEKLRQELDAGQSSFLNILLRNSNCEATELVDRIYAFRGLVDQSELQALGLQGPAHYGEPGKSKAVYRDLCKKVAVNLLKTSGNLNLLSGPVGSPKKRSDWPSWISEWPSWSPDWSSWVPDWAAPKRPGCLLLDQPSFQASRGARTVGDIEFRNQDNILGLEGFVFDSIEEISGIADREPPTTWTFQQYKQYRKRMEDMVEFLQRCLEWEAITNARSKTSYVGGGDNLDAYWQTLLGGHVTKENFEGQKKQFQRFDMISKYGSKILQQWGLPAWPWILLLTPHNLTVLFVRAIVTKRDYLGLLRIGDFTSNPNHTFVRNRRVIRISKGYIGLAPASAERGDAVALFKGASVPLVVRKAKDSQGKWHLVGECYIHGIMSGEAWDEGKCAKMWFV